MAPPLGLCTAPLLDLDMAWPWSPCLDLAQALAWLAMAPLLGICTAQPQPQFLCLVLAQLGHGSAIAPLFSPFHTMKNSNNVLDDFSDLRYLSLSKSFHHSAVNIEVIAHVVLELALLQC